MEALDFGAMRAAMIDGQLRTNNVTEPRLLAALDAVPREAFVPPEMQALAYVDGAIPLGDGRALNPPLVTARLIAEAAILPGEKVLLIGLAPEYAAALIERLGGVVTVSGDGNDVSGPFDAIIVDGAIETVPETFAKLLGEGGRLVCGWHDRGVTRLARAALAGGRLTLVPFAEMDAVRLPGFAAPKTFSF